MYNTVYDVCIYGAGASAVGAALHFLKSNLKVLLISPNGFLGSENTNSFLTEIKKGISDEADKLIAELRAAGAYRDGNGDACVLTIRLLKMLEKVDILFYERPAGVVLENDIMQALLVAGKDGINPISAKCFIDTSDELEIVQYAMPGLVDEQDGDTIFLFDLELDEDLPLPDCPAEEGFIITRNVWDTSRTVKVKNGNRMDIPRILKRLHELAPEFKDAIVTRASNSPVKLAPSVLAAASKIHNLIAPRRRETFTFEQHDSLFSTRMLEGTLLAQRAESIAYDPQIQVEVPDEFYVENYGNESECDILVCGGGTAGAIAAIAAARQGKDVVLWEAGEFLGGTGTGGHIPVYYYGLPGGLQNEVDARAKEISSLLCGRHKILEKQAFDRFHVTAKMIALEEMCREAGVDIHFNMDICEVETTKIKPPVFPVLRGTPQPPEMSRVDSVTAVTPRGTVRCKAKVVIDSTGDGDVAVFAGAQYTEGRDYDAIQHIFSVPAIYLNPTVEKNDKDEVIRTFFTLYPYNIDAGYVDACDPWDVSRGRRSAILAYDRPYYRKNGRLLSIATMIGARASRQITGDFKLGLADQIRSSEFPDVIAYSASHYDNHASDFENESLDALLWSWALDGHWKSIGCEIPYRTLLPFGIENLIVACRAISLDFDANLQFRMQRDMQRIGEAAGLAAAVAVTDHVPPRYIDIRKVQKKLSLTKALAEPENFYHSDSWKPENFYPGHRMFELTDYGFAPSHELLSHNVNDYYDLERNLKSGKPEVKYAAAVQLAAGAHLDNTVEPILKRCIQEKFDKLPSDRHCKTPLWKIAIAICGANHYTETKRTVEDILADEQCIGDQQALILAIRALGAIGDKHSVRMIENLLKRGDIAHTQEFFYWCSEQTIRDDSSWKLELAAFETMYKLGTEHTEYLNKYLNDERGYVRRAAERVRLRVYGR